MLRQQVTIVWRNRATHELALDIPFARLALEILENPSSQHHTSLKY